MRTEFEVKVANEFAKTVVASLQEHGVPRDKARAEIPAIVAAFLSLVDDGAIHVLEDGILIRDASRLEAIVLAGIK